jgi:hypothetical protein
MDRRQFLRNGTAASVTAGMIGGMTGMASAQAEGAKEAPVVETGGPAINVRAFGAVGDGKADDTEAFRKAFLAAGEKTRKNPDGAGVYRVHVPEGRYRITETLELGRKHRFLVIEGVGAGKGTRVPSLLFWDGERGGTLIDAEACWGLQLRHIGLMGSRRMLTSSRKRPGDKGLNLEQLHEKYNAAGILLRINSIHGFVAAEYLFEALSLNDATKGIEIGGSGVDLCGSDMTIEDLGMRDLMTGFQTLGGQNVNFTFVRPEVGNCSVGFDFAGGGSVVALLYAGWKCDRFVKIGRTGINNGNFTFIGFKPELYKGPMTGRRGVILEAAGGEQVISIKSLCSGCIALFGEKGDRDTPMFQLGPGAQLSVKDSLISGKIARLSGDTKWPTWLQMENCRFRAFADPRTDIETDASSGYEVKNCVVATKEKTVFLREHGKYPGQAEEG